MSELSSSAKKVRDYLADNGFDFEVKELPDSTRTAVDAAKAIGCTVDQIAKSLIFKNAETGDPVLIIASGTHQVDLTKVETAIGAGLERADGKFVKKRTGFAIGGVPPVAHKTPLQTVLDESLQQYEQIWAAAGTPNAVFALTPKDLNTLTQGGWIELAG